MRRILFALALAALAGLPGSAAPAACQRSDPGVDVAVALRVAPPFVTDDAIRGRRGLTYELWTSIETELKRDGLIGATEIVECPLGAQLEALAKGDIDLVISPLTITSERMEHFDFTHQYLSSGITVAQRASGGIDFGYAAGILRDTLGQRGMPRAILVFLAANLLIAALMAAALRGGGGGFGVEADGPLPVRLGRYTVEAVVRTIGLKGLGDGARSTAMRTLEIVMAVVGTALSATIFGVLTTALVGSIGGTRQVGLADLPSLRVATLVDSTSQALLEGAARDPGPKLEPVSLRQRPAACVPAEAAVPEVRCVTTHTWSEAIELLAAGQVDAVLGDWAQLTYLARLPTYADAVAVQSATFRLEPYGWGVAAGRPELRAAVDRALMRRLRSPEWRALVQEYMGSGSISPE